MKRTFLSLYFATMAFQASFAQSNASTDPFELQQKVYKQAMSRYDLETAIVAMYQMIALKPSKPELNDSLAMLYFAHERYPQAFLTGEEILKTNPEKTAIRELVAVSKQNIGLIKESLAEYEKLYEQQKTMFYLYQIATLQYQLKRFGECIASLETILNSKEADDQKVSIRMQNGNQEVPMKAAALNVRGICAMELNQPEAAKANFTKALELSPDFVLAKNNLETMNKNATPQPAAETPATTPNPEKPSKKGK